MSRRHRWFYEGVSLHVHQRGNNRTDMFRDTHDRVVFLMALLDASRQYSVAVHAWVLMNTHFHLLATPERPESLPRMMQQVGRRYVPGFNKRHDRTGGLWEGRYSAHLVETDGYWLRCCRYIDLNPVRAALVANPREHAWSSYHAHAYGADDKLVSPHVLYTSLGSSQAERQVAYQTLCGTPLSAVELTSIRNALRTGLSGATLPQATALASALALAS